MKLGTVLALDIATTTGWAWHRQGMPRPFFGAVRFSSGPDNVGQAMHELLLWLRELYISLKADGSPITHFFFEKPFISPAAANTRTSERLLGLCAAVQMFAYQVGATSCFSIDISEARKHFIGRGGGFKRAPGKNGQKGPYLPGHDPKELAIRECAKFGWHTDVHDAAEACGLLDYAISLMDRGFVQNGLPGYPRPWRDNALLGGNNALV